MKTVISVRGISKKYRLGGVHAYKYKVLSDQIAKFIKSPFKRKRQKRLGEFWALKDVSFDVAEGEVLGIIGKNGAGKSTILKLLSQITEPTKGEIRIKGRVGSLLEVGTGFHPELTGRENIYMNGAILGMMRREIKKKFDEIVDFSGVEKFLDTPVKRFSSGMYVRLAFAVAAHLEPEILLVDEVLAVGDAEFQKKCIGKMKSVSTATGRTILFVSHNMSAIRTLCSQALLLSNGRIEYSGSSSEAISQYLSNVYIQAESVISLPPKASSAYFQWIRWKGESHPWQINSGDSLEFQVCLMVKKKLKANLEMVLQDYLNTPLSWIAPGYMNKKQFSLEEGVYILDVCIPSLTLAAGIFYLSIKLTEARRHIYDTVEENLSFVVTECDPNNTGLSYKSTWNLGTVYFPVQVSVNHFEKRGSNN